MPARRILPGGDEIWEPDSHDVAQVAAWMEAHERACPICSSTALRPKRLRRRLAPTAYTERGIDTSDEEDVFDLVCDDCGFDNAVLEVEVVRSWARSRRDPD
jgi:hypothetical protein